MRSFSHLLRLYAERTGISDAELARAIGVRRQTIFRWKEGSVARPRSRDDVLALSQKLRLSPAEQDELLIAAGFHPEGEVAPMAGAERESPAPEPPVLRAQLPETFPLREEADERDPGEKQPAAASGPSRRQIFGLGISGLLLLALLAALALARRAPLPTAAPGETLVVVGQFTNFTGGEIGFNVAGRIADPLRQEIEAAGLAGVRVAVWPDTIRSDAEAQAILARSAAWMVIWGEYDSGRVLARFAQAEATDPLPAVESLVVSPDELFATINSELPQEVRYLALLTLGAYYTGRDAYAQARAVLLRAYATPPQERDALTTLLFRLGLVHQLGSPPDLKRAIDFYTQLLETTPDHLLARYNRGLAFLSRGQPGDWARALEDFDATIQRSPGFLPARVGRGVAYLYRRAEGDDEAALREFTYVIERDGQRPMAYYNRGLLAIRRDMPALWQEDLARVVELAPAFPGGFSGLCWGYVLEGALDRAIPACDAAIRLGAAEAYHSRGIAYLLQGDFDRASADLQAFLAWLEREPAAAPYRGYAGQVQAWLAAAAEGENPITPEVLVGLRVE